MDEGDRQLFERSVRHATGSNAGAALDEALDDLGWPEALSVDPRTAIPLLFELQGRAATTSSALAAVVGSALGMPVGPSAGVVLPTLGGAVPPGRWVGDELLIRGLGPASLADCSTVVVVTESDLGAQALAVATVDLALRPVHGMDPSLGLIEVTGRDVPFAAADGIAPDQWARAMTLGHLAVGHELVGAARAMLDLARDHALGRIQFGRPIGTFQAVRHRLADTLVAIEAAAAALDAAWEEPAPPSAAMAKSLAGRGARVTTGHCQQVLAGMGFTTEHRFHHYVRRVLVLDQLLGAGRSLTRELGRRLLASRQLPALPPL